MRAAPPPLPEGRAFDRPDLKQTYVDWVFSRVAERYDLGNDLMSAGWHTRWKRRLVGFARVGPAHRVLDVAAGTGDVTYLLGERAAEVVGVDNNAEMLAVAERKRPAHGAPNVRFQLADAAALPFPEASFDRVTIVYAGRGFPDFPAVLHEAHRVLVPGGELWNLDFARPSSPAFDRLYRGWMAVSGAALGMALHGHPRTYTYIPASMARYPGQRWLDERMREAGFQTSLVETFGQIMAYNIGVKL